jgi:two-component system chemotaxis response regulator CheB
MRVLITDDSAFMRRAITAMLRSDPDIEIVGAARNGREAVEYAARLKPDVITLDIEMPEMDGLTALRHIMRESPTQVLMLSSLTTEGSHASLRALSLGAADVLAKDQSQVSLKINDLRDELVSRVKALGQSRPLRFGGRSAGQAAERRPDPPKFRPGQFDVVCIGSSTGGPPVLETILASLPASLTTPVIIAQHMPRVFTASMAERLDELCPLEVVHAEDGMPLSSRSVYVAPGGQHLQVHKQGLASWRLSVGDEPREHAYRPSVDALFASAAAATGKRTLAIVLTGIGDDGLDGGRALHALGAPILAQSQETCVVYGMPKAVTRAAITLASLSPTEITRSLLSLVPTAGVGAAA